MSLPLEARLNLGFTTQEFSLLLNVPEMAVEEWEFGEDVHDGVLRSLLVLLKKQPLQCGQVLIEDRINALPPFAPEREMLATLSRRIQGGHTS
jgi:hypothetical protein